MTCFHGIFLDQSFPNKLLFNEMTCDSIFETERRFLRHCISHSGQTRAFAVRREDARAVRQRAKHRLRRQTGVQHMLETTEGCETFCCAQAVVVDAGRRILTIDAADGIPAAVHDTVVVRVGCNCVPVFTAVNGGRSRGLFSFRRVYPVCSAFLDVLVLQCVVVKCVLI